jgi:hypothetical protein
MAFAGFPCPKSSGSSKETLMSENLLRALQTFKLDQHHEKIYADANELIEAGFPASFLLPLIRCFESGTNYVYHWEGKIVDELIGISHLSLVYAIADYLGVPAEIGSRFTGRGFAVEAKIDAIQELLKEPKTGIAK